MGGVCCDEQGKDVEAVDLYLQAKNAYECAGFKGKKEYGDLLRRLGICYRRQGRYEESDIMFDRAKALFESSGLCKTQNFKNLVHAVHSCKSLAGMEGKVSHQPETSMGNSSQAARHVDRCT